SPRCAITHHTATPPPSPPPLHDALPILEWNRAPTECPRPPSPTRVTSRMIPGSCSPCRSTSSSSNRGCRPIVKRSCAVIPTSRRSEEHTSELQSPDQLVCPLLPETKNRR